MKLATRLLKLLSTSESVNDKNIMKAVILAGGPGSGKSFVIDSVIGKSGPVSALGAVLIASDAFLERGFKKLGLPLKFDPNDIETFKKQMDFRKIAVALTKSKMNSIINGLLPFVIDGTGQKSDKIKEQFLALREIGYDVDMIFVNTSLDVAQNRNKERERSLSSDVVSDSWKNVQNNLAGFQNLFGSKSFHLIDNSNRLEGAELKKFQNTMFKMGKKIFEKPLENPKGKALISALRKSGGKLITDIEDKLVDVRV